MTCPESKRRALGSRWGPAAGTGPVRLALCLALFGALACSPADEEPEPAALEPAADAEPAESTGAVEAERWLDELSIGGEVDPRGAIAAEAAREEFEPGETVYVSMAVDDAPADAAVHVAFYDAGGQKVAEDEKKVPAGALHLYFDSGDTTNWPPGSYRVEITVDGEVVEERALTLVPSAS
jgi:hypothetical protein